MNKTVNVILERIYKEKLVNAKLRRNTFKKLIKDCCRKSAFSFNGIIRKQKDGVSMSSSLGPVLANIITELERVIVEPLITSDKIKFYIRYVDDTLFLAKEEDMFILDKLYSFHKNLKFTTDCFEKNNIHFLDIAIDKNKTDVYFKPTHTGQYSDIGSNVPWNYKISLIKSLYYRAEKICSSSEEFSFQINKMKMSVSWNGYPSFTPENVEKEKDDRKIIWIRLQYLGNIGDSLKKNCFKKVQKCF